MKLDNDDAEQLAERQFTAAFYEAVNNGAAINWRYWVHQLPTLTTTEAARLMCGLDPDLFQSLEGRSNENDQTQLCKKAAMIQRLSEREGRACATPGEWLAWASEHQIAVHDGFRLEVESAPATDTPAPAPMVTDQTEAAEPASDKPAPLTTSQIASCFAGFHEWDFDHWRDNLQTPAPWLKRCQHRAGNQGKPVTESTWWPLEIAKALDKKHPNIRQKLHARFKHQEPLKPWLESIESDLPYDD